MEGSTGADDEFTVQDCQEMIDYMNKYYSYPDEVRNTRVPMFDINGDSLLGINGQNPNDSDTWPTIEEAWGQTGAWNSKVKEDYSGIGYNPGVTSWGSKFILANWDSSGNEFSGVKYTYLENNPTNGEDLYSNWPGTVPLIGRRQEEHLEFQAYSNGQVCTTCDILNVYILSSVFMEWSGEGVVVGYARFTEPYVHLLHINSRTSMCATLVHELGHVFCLEHTWGNTDDYDAASNAYDDGVTDTPYHKNPGWSSGMPSYRDVNDLGNPIMWENFMTYAEDRFLHVFTQGQKQIRDEYSTNYYRYQEDGSIYNNLFWTIRGGAEVFAERVERGEFGPNKLDPVYFNVTRIPVSGLHMKSYIDIILDADDKKEARLLEVVSSKIDTDSEPFSLRMGFDWTDSDVTLDVVQFSKFLSVQIV